MTACRACGRPLHAEERLDKAATVREYGLGREDVDRVFARLEVTAIPGSRKRYVRRGDLEEYLQAHTYRAGYVPSTVGAAS